MSDCQWSREGRSSLKLPTAEERDQVPAGEDEWHGLNSVVSAFRRTISPANQPLLKLRRSAGALAKAEAGH